MQTVKKSKSDLSGVWCFLPYHVTAIFADAHFPFYFSAVMGQPGGLHQVLALCYLDITVKQTNFFHCVLPESGTVL